MSNPLLQPNDRFRRPSLTDDAGRSLFVDSVPSEKTGTTEQQANSPSYRPQYEAILPNRARYLTYLGTTAFILSLFLCLPFMIWFVQMTDTVSGYLFMFGITLGPLGVLLSLVVAIDSYRELSGIAQGAVEPEGRDTIFIVYCFAMMSVLAGLSVVVWILSLILKGILELPL